MKLHTLDFVCIVLYLGAIVLLGAWFSRQQKTTRDYFLAGKSMRWLPLAISMYASLFSSISYVMAPAEAFQHDLQYLMALICFPIASILAIVLFIDFFMRLRITTIFEYLEARFNSVVALVMLAAYMIFRCIYAGIVVFSLALVLHVTMDLPLVGMMIVVGAGAIVYTMLGGMKAVIWTDVAQFVILVGGILLALILAIRAIPGGFAEAWRLAGDEGKLRLVNTDFDLTQRYVVWTLLIYGIVDFLGSKSVDQINVQRYLSAKSARHAKLALITQSCFTLPVWLLLFALGTCLFAYYHHRPSQVVNDYIAAGQYDRIFPQYIFEVMPIGVRGFMIAALLAAAMSTMDSVLHVLSTISVVNVYNKYINPNATDDRQLRWARRMIVVWGIVVILTAMAMRDLKSILVAANSVIALFVGPMLGVFLLGMFSKRVNWQGALTAVAAGTLVGYLLKFHTSITFTILGAATLGTVLVVGRLASEFFPAPCPKSLQGLNWRWRGWKEMLLGDPTE